MGLGVSEGGWGPWRVSQRENLVALLLVSFSFLKWSGSEVRASVYGGHWIIIYEYRYEKRKDQRTDSQTEGKIQYFYSCHFVQWLWHILCATFCVSRTYS